MKSGRSLLWVLVVLLAGCSSVRLSMLDNTLRAYERAIRWSDFKTAYALANNPNAAVPDFQRLQDIRVTSYDKLGAPQGDADGMKLKLAVELRYVNVNNMSERVLQDEQTWEYVEKEDRWRLTSPFPAFK